MTSRDSHADDHECHVDEARIVAATVKILADFVAKDSEKLHEANYQYEFISVFYVHLKDLKLILTKFNVFNSFSWHVDVRSYRQQLKLR